MRRIALLAGVVWFSGCLDTQIPPSPGAGSITGRVLVAAPGEALGRPAAGATITLIESGLSVTAGDDGRFDLRPIPANTGTLRFASGALTRLTTLEAIGAGPGKVTVLGDVPLSLNASIQGEVWLEDDPNAEGTLVFVEGEPSSTFTNRTGQFLLRELPVGRVSLAVFRRGYAPVSLPIDLRSGERFVVDRIVLAQQTVASSTVRGKATLADQEDSSGITVTGNRGGATTTPASGEYSIAAIEPGVHSFSFRREGFGTVTLANRLVGAPQVALPNVVLVPGVATAVPTIPAYPPYDGGRDEPDAGQPDAGQPDAGQPDAGQPDAGQPDAGQPDAGQPDASVDLFPVAVIAPLPSRTLQDAGPLLLNGTNSYGTPVLTNYAWLVDAGTARLRDGGIVRPSTNDSAFASAPSLELPVAPAVVTVSLQVTDALGRMSAPAVTGFVVGDRPLALFDGGLLTTMYSGQSTTIDATPSRDTIGSNIVSRRWVTSPGAPITATPITNDAQLRIDVGTVTFTQQVTISHYVTNGLGFESLERTHSITLLTGTIPDSPWSVSTLGAITADGGTVVALTARLDAGSQVAAYADPANYDWLWTALTDAGSPPTWAITDPAQPSTAFIPPVVEGVPVRYDFSVSATPKPPLAPGAKSATFTVLAYDKVRPQLWGLGLGSASGTLLTFSETMIPTNNIDIARMPANASVIGLRMWRGNQLMLITRPMPAVNEMWEFRLAQNTGGVTDTVGNTLIPLDATAQYRAAFMPEVRWTPTFELATSEMTIEPQPVLFAQPTPVLGQHTGTLVARIGSTLVAGSSSGLLSDCPTPPCTFATQPFATGVPTTVSSANTLFTHQGTTYSQPAPGQTFAFDGGALPSAPGLVFSQGAKPGSFYVAGTTLRLAELDGGAWDTTNALTAFTSATFDPTSVVVGAHSGEAPPNRVTCVAVQTGVRVAPLTRLNSGNFGIPLSNNPAATVLSVSQVRVGATASTCYFTFLKTDGELVFTNRSAGDFGSTGNLVSIVPSGVSAADVIADTAGYFWLTTIESGQLKLYGTAGGPGSTPTQVGGVLNVNPACPTSRPTLSMLDQAVYLTWQEQCAGQPWKVYARGLY